MPITFKRIKIITTAEFPIKRSDHEESTEWCLQSAKEKVPIQNSVPSKNILKNKNEMAHFEARIWENLSPAALH